MGRHRKSAIGEVITGIIMISIPFIFFGGFPSVGMGMHMGFPFWSWLLVALGAGSLIRGITKLAAKSKKIIDSKPNAKKRKLELENKVLKAAKKAGGQVTIARTALFIDAPIEETESILNSLASRGHANVEVSTEGQILYMFPDFLDRDLIDS
ncbi:MAG: hypothetical protein PF693_08085 [Spirochaetia bacterium]|jgi:hypothetical protein|nr:hypothetical protein [Spirochaetia bacterium]